MHAVGADHDHHTAAMVAPTELPRAPGYAADMQCDSHGTGTVRGVA